MHGVPPLLSVLFLCICLSPAKAQQSVLKQPSLSVARGGLGSVEMKNRPGCRLALVSDQSRIGIAHPAHKIRLHMHRLVLIPSARAGKAFF